jgi:hypothetical protein
MEDGHEEGRLAMSKSNDSSPGDAMAAIKIFLLLGPRSLGTMLRHGLAMLLLAWAALVPAADLESADLPPCDVTAPGMSSGVSVGLAQPYAAPAVMSLGSAHETDKIAR